jgi:hypothetical protein
MMCPGSSGVTEDKIGAPSDSRLHAALCMGLPLSGPGATFGLQPRPEICLNLDDALDEIFAEDEGLPHETVILQ